MKKHYILPALLLSHFAVAEQEHLALKEVSVYGEALSNSTVAAPIDSVSKEDIDRLPVTHTDELLTSKPSVYTITSFNRPTTSVNIRGLQDFGRVNTSIDGMRQNYQQSGHMEKNGEALIDSGILVGADITKGPESGAGGAGAIAGKVNFRTLNNQDILKPGKKIGALVRYSIGVGKYKNGKDGNSLLAVGIKPNDMFNFTIAHSHRKAGDYQIGNHGNSFWGEDFSTGKIVKKKLPPMTVKGTDYSLESTLLKGTFTPVQQHQFGFSYLTTKSHFSDIRYNIADKKWITTKPNTMKSENISLSHHWTATDETANISTTLYRVITENVRDTIDNYGGIYKSDGFKLTTHGINIDSNWQGPNIGGASTQFNIGLELFKDKSSPTATRKDEFFGTTPPGTRILGGIYTNTGVNWNNWAAHFGLRYDYYHLNGRAKGIEPLSPPFPPPGMPFRYTDTPVNKSKGAFSPSFKLSYFANDNIELYGKIGSAWRPPAITETLLSAPRHFSLPNPYLAPERVLNKEVGINGNFDSIFKEDDKLNFHLGYYHNAIDNFITNKLLVVKHPNFPWPVSGGGVFVNTLGKTKTSGFELSLNYDAGNWYAGLSGSTIRYSKIGKMRKDTASPYYLEEFRGRSGGNFRHPFPSQQKAQIQLGFRALDKKLDAGIIYQYIGSISSYDDQKSSLGSGTSPWTNYDLINLYASYEPIQDLKLRLGVNNLMDRQYALPLSSNIDNASIIPGPGRTVMATFEYKF